MTHAMDEQRGVALVIVVWFVAGMTLLVAGIVSIAKVDTKMAQLHLARAKTVAAGDGAINLIMADRVVGEKLKSPRPFVLENTYQMNDLKVTVQLSPAAGLVDINEASVEVLGALFFAIGEVGPSQAKYLADNVVKLREEFSGKRAFYSVEDLLKVEGITRTLFDEVRDYVIVSAVSTMQTNWAMAPEELMVVMRKANAGDSARLLRRRDALLRSFNSSQSDDNGKQGKKKFSGVYRADALVKYGEQLWLRRRWVSMEQSPQSKLPWRVVRTEPPRVATGV